MAQSRREFLKSAGAVGAVAVAGGSSVVGGSSAVGARPGSDGGKSSGADDPDRGARHRI